MDLLPFHTSLVQQLSLSLSSLGFAGGSLWRQDQPSSCHSTESPAGFPARAFQGTRSFHPPGLPNVSASWRFSDLELPQEFPKEPGWAGTQHLQMILTVEEALQPPKHHLPSPEHLNSLSATINEEGDSKGFCLQPIPLLQELNKSHVLHGWHSSCLRCTSGRCSLEVLQGTAPALGHLWHREDVLAFQSCKDLLGADPLLSWTSWAAPRDPLEE